MEPAVRIVHILSTLQPTGINFLLQAEADDPAFKDVTMALVVLCPEQPELRKPWTARGVEVIFCPPLPAFFEKIPSDTLRTWIKKAFRFLMPRRIRNRLLRLHPDIVHLHYLYYFREQVLASAGGRWRLVINLHNTYARDLLDRSGILSLLPLLQRQGCRWIAVSEAVKRHFLAFAPALSSGIQVIPNGVAPDKLRGNPGLRFSERARMRAAWGFASDAVVFGAAGRLTAQKGFDVLLRAAGKVLAGDARARFVIAGEGEERSIFEKMISSGGLKDRVLLCGFVQNMSAFYAGLDVFVVSSHDEGSPLVLHEALAAGLPAVSTRVGDAPELLSDSPSCLVAPGDAEALATALSAMISPEVRSREEAKVGLRADFLRWDRCCQSYRRIYRQLKE